MKRALIISSYVAASSVGANVTAFAMRSFGIEAVMLPTTLYGRHPGWGDPGGAITPLEILAGMWQGIKSQNLQFDAVITGYMGHPDMVGMAVDIITLLKSNNPDCLTFVDPVMGDDGRLYVSEQVAGLIKSDLIPIADFITPNVWELSYILDRPLETFDSVSAALQSRTQKTVVTSVERERQIGALLSDGKSRHLVEHAKFDTVPHGGGDTLTGLFAAHILRGKTARDALRLSVSSVFSLMRYGHAKDRAELPIFEFYEFLGKAPSLIVEDII
ncbi:MAG: pyridoxine kinase [Hellea sp.]|nr:pyridoxine kinase [Hellea sp.]